MTDGKLPDHVLKNLRNLSACKGELKSQYENHPFPLVTDSFSSRWRGMQHGGLGKAPCTDSGQTGPCLKQTASDQICHKDVTNSWVHYCIKVEGPILRWLWRLPVSFPKSKSFAIWCWTASTVQFRKQYKLYIEQYKPSPWGNHRTKEDPLIEGCRPGPCSPGLSCQAQDQAEHASIH